MAEDTYGQAYTDRVIAATGDKTSPRLKEIMSALIQHLHDFTREVNLSMSELQMALGWINACGQKSDDTRNETHLMSDVLGVDSLVDEITSRLLASSNPSSHHCTPSAILGPFYRPDAPMLPFGSSLIAPENRKAYLSSTAHTSGRVLSPEGQPIADAVLDVWHTAPNGMYEQQDPAQPEMDLRGRFRTDDQGRFRLYCLRPVSYPIPDDGPAGSLLRNLDRHPNRPAHVHFIITAPGFVTLTTQLFDSEDQWLCNDAVFAVKPDLVVHYLPREGDPQAEWSMTYDFVLARSETKTPMAPNAGTHA